MENIVTVIDDSQLFFGIVRVIMLIGWVVMLRYFFLHLKAETLRFKTEKKVRARGFEITGTGALVVLVCLRLCGLLMVVFAVEMVVSLLMGR